MRRGDAADWQWLQIPTSLVGPNLFSVSVAATTFSTGLLGIGGAQIWVFVSTESGIEMWRWSGELDDVFHGPFPVPAPEGEYKPRLSAVSFRKTLNIGDGSLGRGLRLLIYIVWNRLFGIIRRLLRETHQSGPILGFNNHVVLAALDKQSRLMLTEFIVGSGDIQTFGPRPADDGQFLDNDGRGLSARSLASLSATVWAGPFGLRIFSVAMDPDQNLYWNESVPQDALPAPPNPWVQFLISDA